MKLKSAITGILLILPVASLLDVSSAGAVPAFARRESARCQMCHMRMPELNEDGHSYIRRGLREERGSMATDMGMDMNSKKVEVPEPVASTKRPLGEALPLQWQNYLTLMGHHTYDARRGAKAALHPGVIDGWIGGPLDQHWTGMANFAIDIEAGGVEVEQAYAQYNSSWTPRFTSVRVGQLLPFVVLFNGGGPAMPLSAPVVMEMPVRAGNPWVPATLVRGVEVGVVNLPRWNAYVGAGQPQLGELAGGDHTDLYATGEVLVGSKGNAVSGLAYRGKIAPSDRQVAIAYTRLAGFANAYGPHVKGVLGVLWGTDKPRDSASLNTAGGFLLGEVMLAERWAGYARYDYAHRQQPIGDAETTDGPTVGVSFWAQTQVRLTFESRFVGTTGAPRDRTAMTELLWIF